MPDTKAMSNKQYGVLQGMVIGALLSILIVGGAVCNVLPSLLHFHPQNDDISSRLQFFVSYLPLLSIPLVLAIGRMAGLRFFSPQDIDGSGLTTQTTQTARVYQAVIQNTLEQTVIAIPGHLIWCVSMPLSGQHAGPLAAVMFIWGRLLFAVGYSSGAEARSLGFTLTFYPTVVMYLCIGVNSIL
eukprot:gb/GECH01000072.1/.p1 GENE.gb/GECH01000072.1/~~gb/GECH01000072.1/.p1  ORF type:complete len:185 (+),score=24.68 gb/GECH01000072.1/:1-555(+)